MTIKHFETNAQKNIRRCRCSACIALRKPPKRTSIEIILSDFLLREFPIVVNERTFGKYRVDCYLPYYHIAFEAQGRYWHSKPGAEAHDKKRSAFLLKKYGLIIIPIWEEELKEIGKMFTEIDKENK